jgi:hypothetical protein
MNYVEQDGNLVVLRGKVHDDEVLQAASLLRRQGKGFTKDKGMRRIAAIDPERFNAVMLQGDKDALDFAASGYRDRKSLRRLLFKYPEWRTSEGAV